MLTNVLYVSKIIVNFINIVFLNEKKIEAYFSFNKSAYLNYFDQHVIFANNVHKQYLLKINVNMIMSFRERQLKQQKLQKKSSFYCFVVFKKITNFEI